MELIDAAQLKKALEHPQAPADFHVESGAGALVLHAGHPDNLKVSLKDPRLDRKQAMEDVLVIVQTLHAYSFVWGDLKTAQFVYSIPRKCWKIVDAAAATKKGTVVSTANVTYGYAAPEVLEALESKQAFQAHPSMDVASLGWTLL